MALLTYCDAEAALAGWVNAQSDLVGSGNPLPKGALLNRMRGAAPGAYVYLSQVGGSRVFGAESPDARARIGGQIFGATKEAALRGAIAYADALSGRLAGVQTTVAGIGLLLVVDDITGPLFAPDHDEPRYLVDVDVICRPL